VKQSIGIDTKQSGGESGISQMVSRPRRERSQVIAGR